MDSLTGKVIRGYVIEDLIGEGGFGAVYRARQPIVDRIVAVKIIWPFLADSVEFIRRFEAEARTVASLEHPQIVPMYDFWREPQGAYMVMRYLRKGNLRNLMGQQWKAEEANRVLGQVAGALALAHRYGVIHRDIKPENILLDEENNAYLSDFGIAQIMGSTSADESSHIGSMAYAAPEQLENAPASPQTDQYSLALLVHELLSGQHAFASMQSMSYEEILAYRATAALPLLTQARPDLPRAINEVLARATHHDPRRRFPDTLTFAAAFHDAFTYKAKLQAEAVMLEDDTLVRAPDGTIITAEGSRLVDNILPAPETYDRYPNPYRGLRSFSEGDALYFYGREKLTEHLVNRLAENTPTGTHRFLAVVGPSGSGKSSLVKAGLLPVLRQGALPGSDRWFMVGITPGSHPLEELEIGLLRVAARSATNLREHLERDERGLVRVLKLILPDDDSELLLVIDQFEELFTMVENTEHVRFVLDSLHNALCDPNSRFRLIVTLRADFYDRPLLYENFSGLMRQRTEVVVPMSSEELERAITEPSRKAHVTFEPGLTATIVSEVSGQLGALPLLQYGLTELYENRESETITLETYRKIGGILGALARRAEELYLSLNDQEKQATQQLFLRLVTLGEGTEDTRRRVLLSEMLSITGSSDVMQAVVDRLSAARLLTFDRDPVTRGPTVEVAHEAILREWTRLRTWLDHNRDEVRLQRTLAAMAHDWEKAQYDSSFLLRGLRLEQYEQWRSETSIALTDTEKAYLEHSFNDREARRAQEREREVVQQRLESRAQNRLRMLLGVMIFATVIAFILTGIAFNQSISAQNAQATSDANATLSRTLALVANARSALSSGNTDVALSLAWEANHQTIRPAEAQRLLADIGLAPGTRRRIEAHTATVRRLIFASDPAQFVTTGGDFNVILWDTVSGEPLRNFQGHEDTVAGLSISSDNRHLLTGSDDGSIILWDVETGEPLLELTGHNGDVNSVALSSDGNYFASGGGDQQIALYDAETGELLRSYEGHRSIIHNVTFSPDSRYLASGDDDGEIIVWDVESGERLRRLNIHSGRVRQVLFSPNGETLLSAGEDATVILWDFETGQARHVMQEHTRVVHDVAFGPDGKTAFSVSADSTHILWNLTNGTPLQRFRSENGVGFGVAYHPNGKTVLVGYTDGSVREWDLSSVGEMSRYTEAEVGFVRVAVSPDGRHALTSTGPQDIDNLLFGNPELLYIDLETGALIRRLRGHLTPVTQMVFRSDGRSALSSSLDGTVILWNLEQSEVVRRFNGHRSFVYGMDVNIGGTRMVSSSADRTVIVWDIVTGEALATFEAHTRPVTAVHFHPDGRRVVSGTDNGELILWDSETGEVIRRYEGHSGIIFSADFTSDGTRMISGSLDTNTIEWDVETGERLHIMDHAGLVTTVDYSANDQYILTGTENGQIVLWRALSGEQIREYTGHVNAVTGVKFAPDGRSALTASLDGTLRRWAVPDEDFQTDLLSIIAQNRYIYVLNCEEEMFYGVRDRCD